MAIHDWARVDAGIFHAFHHGWTAELARALNGGILPGDHYALLEHHAAGRSAVAGVASDEKASSDVDSPEDRGGLLLAASTLAPTAETDRKFYRRKQSSIVVRHVSGDRVTAMVEVVSPANKSARHALRSFVEKATEMLDRHVHLLVLDLHPPGPRDPNGIHAAIWDEVAGQEYVVPPDTPLTLAAYETDLTIRAYVKAVAVGDPLPEMPLFLKPNGYVQVPLDATYRTAFAAMPRRWRRVLEAGA